ncbi:hypothetical protein [Enterococcus pingfangensis]|uniref:hypothetical protein n=1 Tax=Enterococcus pingfangensis TaxID=2559924 RepID=UPI0010F7C171|nr:hypothetical protein [Enterococcus pingfangensis]
MKRALSHRFFRKKSNLILFSVILLFTLVRILIQMKIPPITFAGGGVDEHVFVMQATEFIKGNWFGNYNSSTLVKNPTYSFFYILIYKFAISYSLALISLYIFAIVLLLIALAPIIKNKYYRTFAYLFLLYSPVMMDKKFGLRLYRDALLTPLVFLVLGSVIGLFLYRNKSKWISLLWSISAGISYLTFYYLREDSIWLKPFFYVALIITLLFVLFSKFNIKAKLIHITILLIPILIFQGGTSLLSYQNLKHYGIYAVNDHTQTSFGNVITDLVSIDDGTSQTYIWVHESALRQAMEVSPTLKKLEEQFDSFYIPNSTLTTKIDSESQAEIFSGKIVWLLRLAVERAGLGYKQEILVNGETVKGGKATNDFYTAVHKELTEAFKVGQLKKRSAGIAVSQSAPTKTIASILENVIPKMLYTAKETIMYTEYYVDNGISQVSGSVDAVREIETLINTPLNYPIGSAQSAHNRPVTAMIRRINSIMSIYKYSSILVTILSMSGFAYAVISMFRKAYEDKFFAISVISLGLFLSYIILLLGVSWAYSWVSGETMNRLYFYSSGTIPVLQLIYILCGYSFIEMTLNLIKKLKIK